MSTAIYPMAMIPKTNTTIKLYFLAFPAEWKELLVKLQVSVDPKFNTQFNLKTNVLYGYLNGWLNDVVQVNTMRQDSDDSQWFVSVKEPDTEKICEILQIWIAAEYCNHRRKTAETEKLADELLSRIDAAVLKAGMTVSETALFDAEGHAATDYAFSAFSLWAANALIGKTITVAGHELTWASCGTKELISQPLTDGKQNAGYYAIGLQFSVQTTPPERTCMLLIDCSIKRFISNSWKKCIYLTDDIHAYIAAGSYKYRRLTLRQRTVRSDDADKKTYIREWSKPEQDCYHLYHTDRLPDAEDVLRNPEQYLKEASLPRILLPYKNGMDFTDMHIGTGVSFKDKQEILSQISALMQDFAQQEDAVQPISRSYIIHAAPSEKLETSELQRLRRERLKACTGLSALQFEVYGHAADKALFEQLKAEAENYLGGEEYQSVFPVKIQFRELGALSDMMKDSSYLSHCQRIEDVKRLISPAETVTGAIIVLADTRDQPGDPKHALRAGFADTNRLTQFITPDLIKQKDEDAESPKHRVHSAVMDLLRQFGYTEFYETRKMKNHPCFDADAIGIYVLHQLKPLRTESSRSARDTARFLPVYVTYQVRTGKLFVDSDLLPQRHMSYPEALIAFSKLSREADFVPKCVDAARGGFRTKLLSLQRLYRDSPALIFTQSNGITRQLWHGLTDKKISEYEWHEQFVPKKIEVGKKDFSDMTSFCGTGIRIMRIRENHSTHEVPDYYPGLNAKGKLASASGIYKYRQVFWGLESRPFNKEYTGSYRSSRLDHPKQNFDECGLVEFYPLQLQAGDQPEQWVAFSNYLREVMPEANRSVRLPVPLHFAGLIEEYLLLATHRK